MLRGFTLVLPECSRRSLKAVAKDFPARPPKLKFESKWCGLLESSPFVPSCSFTVGLTVYVLVSLQEVLK